MSDQEARIALVDYFGSHLRFWGTTFVAFAVGFFAIVQVKNDISWFYVPSLIALLSQSVYSISRVLWHGKMAEMVMHADPQPGNEPLLYRLRRGAEVNIPGESTWGRILSFSNGVSGWFCCTVLTCIAVAIPILIATIR